MESIPLRRKELSVSRVNLPPEQEIDLLKILSHDLRGSLVSMSAILHVISRDQGTNDGFVETKLAELIDKMDGLSSMLQESLQMVLALEEDGDKEQNLLDFKRDIIEPVIAEFGPEIRGRNLRVDNELSTVTGFFIASKINKTVIKMIFRNLFSNAVKYCDRGGNIAVAVKHGSPFCLLKVYNSGGPIAEGLREKLFSKPIPPTSRIEKRPDGMGLGLHLAKRIMQTQGGEIWYEPDEYGSTFVMAIPVETGRNRYSGYVQGVLFA